MRARFWGLILLTLAAPAVDAAPSDIALTPLHGKGNTHYPRLTAFPDAKMRDRVNGIFAGRDRKEAQDRRECLKQLQESQTTDPDPYDIMWDVTRFSRRFISLQIGGNINCGGPYPVNGPFQPLNIDLSRGTEMNWKDYFKPGFLTVTDPKTFDPHVGKLALLYRARYNKLRSDKDDAECRDAVASQGFLNVQISMDQAQGGLVVSPELPHVVQACDEDIAFSADELAPYITDPGLIADLREMKAPKGAKN